MKQDCKVAFILIGMFMIAVVAFLCGFVFGSVEGEAFGYDMALSDVSAGTKQLYLEPRL